MSQILDEQLSAFIDGELPPEELDMVLARLDRDPALRLRLGRYALIGECMRSGSARLDALPLAERVRGSLAAGSVQPVPDARRGAGRRRWLAAGLAAALAVVALLALQPGAWQAPFRPESEVAASRPVARVGDDELGTVHAAVSQRLDPRSVARLTGYLVAHGEYANQFSRSALDSHLVTARAERASWRQGQDPADVR
jgi:anti-sigma factor RsiW